MYTTRADGTLLHGYPTRVRINGTVQTPFNANPIAIPGELEVEEYDNGGEGLAYHDNEAANIPGGFRLEEGVDIGALGDGFILEYVASGEWIEYAVDVMQSGIYSVKAETASEVANGAFKITFDKNNASTNFSPPSTNDWYTFQEITANGEIELEAGVQQMRLDITNNNPFNLDKLIFTLETATNINDINIEENITISPNPTDGFINIEFSEVLKGNNNLIEIFRVTGEEVGTFNIEGKSATLDLSDLKSGIYLLQVSNDDLNLVRRLVKK